MLAAAACEDGDDARGAPAGSPGATGTAPAVGTPTPSPTRTGEAGADSPAATATAGETAAVTGKPAVYWVHTDW
jgi:hypothetical protein